jgi:hypothetical protein
MTEAAPALAAVAVSVGWKWLAVLIGLGVLVVIGLAVTVFTHGQLTGLVNGSDGRASTSKFQWLAWLVVFVFSYSVLWVLRVKQGDWSAITNMPANLLTVLGFSTGTAAAAKGITAGYVQSGRLVQPPPGSAKSGLVTDDSGAPDLSKLQIVAFTLIAIGIFVATLIHQIVSNPVITALPNIDSSLLVLMGISQGGYLANKLVTFNRPVLYAPQPPNAIAGQTEVMVPGANLGIPVAGGLAPAGAQLLLNGAPITPAIWAPTVLKFTVPAHYPAGQASVAVFVLGQQSNAVHLMIQATVSTVSNGADGTTPIVTHQSD